MSQDDPDTHEPSNDELLIKIGLLVRYRDNLEAALKNAAYLLRELAVNIDSLPPASQAMFHVDGDPTAQQCIAKVVMQADEAFASAKKLQAAWDKARDI